MAQARKKDEAATAPLPSSYTTDADQLAALRAPFPVSEVKTREQGGATLHYYEAATIQQRLLDVLGTGLSIRTNNVITTECNVNIETVLDIEWVSGRKSSVSGWGSADILMSKSGRIANDPYKAAATDSIKVAASKLGVAGELYDSKYRETLAARLKAEQEAEANRAFLTCQECNGTINGGKVMGANGNEVELTAQQVALSTRKKFGERLCIGCAEKRREA